MKQTARSNLVSFTQELAEFIAETVAKKTIGTPSAYQINTRSQAFVFIDYQGAVLQNTHQVPGSCFLTDLWDQISWMYFQSLNAVYSPWSRGWNGSFAVLTSFWAESNNQWFTSWKAPPVSTSRHPTDSSTTVWAERHCFLHFPYQCVF